MASVRLPRKINQLKSCWDGQGRCDAQSDDAGHSSSQFMSGEVRQNQREATLEFHLDPLGVLDLGQEPLRL